jgi:uncharacterized protein YqgC (DUF456 family)
MVDMERILRWKLLPRGMMALSGLLVFQASQWFMYDLGASATTQQTAFVSTICGCFSGMFAVWVNHESKPVGGRT